MVGHPAQRYAGNAISRQHLPYPYHHQAASHQLPVASQHILAPGVAPAYGLPPDIYHQSLISKHIQHSPEIPAEQHSPATSSSSSQEGDHPIGYGAFGVVWLVSMVI